MGSPPHRRFFHLARLAALLLCMQGAPAVAEMEEQATQALPMPQPGQERQENEPRPALGQLPTETLAAPPPSTPLVAVPPVVEGPSFLRLLVPSAAQHTGPVETTPVDEPDMVAISEVPLVISEPAEPLAPPPVQRLEVTLDWYLSPEHALLLIAREKGMFKRRGLEVALVTPADPSVPAKLLAAGRTDLAVGRQTQLHLLADQGLPLVRVATLIDTPMAGLALRDSVLAGLPSETRYETLTFGYIDQDGRDILLARALAHLMEISTALELVETREVNYGVLTALREGQVDAMMLHQRFLPPRQWADEGIATRLLPVEELGLPPHDGLILMANRDQINGKRDAIRYFVAALEEAALWIVNHPEKAWSIMAEAEPLLNDPNLRETWKDIMPRLALRPAAVDLGRYRRFDQYLLEAGLLERGTSAERLAIDLDGQAP